MNLLLKGDIDTGIELLPRDNYKLDDTVNSFNSIPEMPPLMKMYLRYGAKIIGKPAIDREFKTIDYFVLLDLDKLTPESFKMFLAE